MRSMTWLGLLAAFVAGCARPTPEMQIVQDAVEAVGGKESIQAVKTLAIEGQGENYNLGQNLTPEAPLPVFDVTAYRRVIDLENGRWRQEQTRVARPPAGNTAPQKQVAALDGNVAFNVAPSGAATRAVGRVATDRKGELRHHPLGILQAALKPDAKVTNARRSGQLEVVDVTTNEGVFTLAIDSTTKLPKSVTSMTDNVNLGDVALETQFGGYQDVGGLKLPMQITSRTDKYTLADIKVSNNTVNLAPGDLAAPATVKSAPADPPAPTVTVEALGKGLWMLAGQTHHSVLVEFADHLTLVEAPQNDARTLAVIAKARETVPGKPLTHLVMTHHHFDHSGGIRAAVAEGLTLITHESLKPFVEDVASRKHTIAPDALAKSPKPAKVETVGEEHVLTDAARTVNLYTIPGNQHATSLLMLYFPKEKVLTTADLYNPPAPNAPPPPSFPFAGSLVDGVQTRKLAVSRLAGIHGRVVPFTDVVAAAKGAPAPKATR